MTVLSPIFIFCLHSDNLLEEGVLLVSFQLYYFATLKLAIDNVQLAIANCFLPTANLSYSVKTD